MARHPSITNEQILEAAREIFIAHGYSARTADIAARAGISEGSIFRRFKDKETLFFAALQIRYPPPWHDLLDPRLDDCDPKEHLRMLAIAIMDEFAQIIPRMVTAATKGPFPPPPEKHPMRDMPEPPPLRDAKVLTAFLDRMVTLGKIRDCNTEYVAHTIMGAISQFPLLAMFPGTNITTEQCRDFALGMAELLWFGLCPLPD